MFDLDRIEKLFGLMPDEADCLLITSDENRFYFTGMKSSAGIVLCFKSKSYLIIDFRYIEKARKTVKSCEVIQQESAIKQIKELFEKHGAKRVFVESEKMTLSQFDAYKSKLEGYEFNCTSLLSEAIWKLRIVKDDDEIEKISQAQNISEKAFEHMLGYIKEGRTEKEISLELEWFMQKNGAEAISFDTIVLSGKKTSMPHGVPSDKAIGSGEFVLMDFGAVVDGYHADMTRTVCVGKPTDDMTEVYNIVLNAQETALAAARAGITGKQLDDSARSIITEAGYGKAFGHSLGHGVGLDIHEQPVASCISEVVLEKNMLVTVEPGIYIPDKFGIRIEDLVVITDNSCKNLNKTPKNLICL